MVRFEMAVHMSASRQDSTSEELPYHVPTKSPLSCLTCVPSQPSDMPFPARLSDPVLAETLALFFMAPWPLLLFPFAEQSRSITVVP